ncbi:hypothetical protein EMCRGX_G008998 [Ephydatia muelleri]
MPTELVNEKKAIATLWSACSSGRRPTSSNAVNLQRLRFQSSLRYQYIAWLPHDSDDQKSGGAAGKPITFTQILFCMDDLDDVGNVNRFRFLVFVYSKKPKLPIHSSTQHPGHHHASRCEQFGVANSDVTINMACFNIRNNRCNISDGTTL